MSAIVNPTYTVGSSHVHSINASTVAVSGTISGSTYSSIHIDESAEVNFAGGIAAKILELYLSGKDLVADKQEYLDLILKLPSVKGDTLKAVETFERLKKISRVLCL